MTTLLPDLTPQNFRAVLRSARLREGFNKNDASRRLHCSPNYITAIEEGKTFPSLERVSQLARLYVLEEDKLEAAVTEAKALYAANQVYERARNRALRNKGHRD